MADSETVRPSPGRERAERLTHGLIAALASALAVVLQFTPVRFIAGLGAQSATGGGSVGGLAVAALCFAVLALPPGLAFAVFRSRRKRGDEPLEAAAPAAMALLGASVVPWTALLLAIVFLYRVYV